MKKLLLFGLVFLLLACSGLVSAIKESELLSCYDFDTNSTTEVDYQNRYNFTRENSPTFTTSNCVQGNCYDFGGSGTNDAYYQANFIDPDDHNDGLAICMWINADVDNARQFPFCIENAAVGGVRLDYQADGTIDYRFGSALHETTYSYATGSFEFVCISHSSTRDILWVNGVERGNGSSVFIKGTGTKTRIGNYWDQNFGFNGKIDIVAVFNKSGGLNQDDVTTMYNYGTGKDCSSITDSTPDTTPPLIYNPTCTSCPSGTNISTEINPNTPTVVIDVSDATGVDGACISNSSVWNYTQCTTEGAKCTLTGLNYTCTIPADNAFGFGNNTAYFWANDTLGNSHNAYNLSIVIRSPELSGTCKDSSGNPVKDCITMAILNGTATVAYSANSTIDGKWSITADPGIYTTCTYHPYNSSLYRGDCQANRVVT